MSGRRPRKVLLSVLASLPLAAAARAGPADPTAVRVYCDASRDADAGLGIAGPFDLKRCLCEAGSIKATGKDRRTPEQARTLCTARIEGVDCARPRVAYERSDARYKRAQAAAADKGNMRKGCASIRAARAWVAASRPYTLHCEFPEARAEFGKMLDEMERSLSGEDCR